MGTVVLAEMVVLAVPRLVYRKLGEKVETSRLVEGELSVAKFLINFINKVIHVAVHSCQPYFKGTTVSLSFDNGAASTMYNPYAWRNFSSERFFGRHDMTLHKAQSISFLSRLLSFLFLFFPLLFAVTVSRSCFHGVALVFPMPTCLKSPRVARTSLRRSSGTVSHRKFNTIAQVLGC